MRARVAVQAVGLFLVLVNNSWGQNPVPIGPGDPTSLLAHGFDLAWSIAANKAGDVFFVDGVCCGPGRVLRIRPTGELTNLTPEPLYLHGGIAVTEAGQILVTGLLPVPNQLMTPVVWRITETGQRWVFATVLAHQIAVGPGGDVWLAAGSTIVQLDRSGLLKDQWRVPDAVNDLAFSPDGELHFSSFDRIYTLHHGQARVVWVRPYGSGWPELRGLAFDRNGYLYVAVGGPQTSGSGATVVLLDPEYRLITDPFALLNHQTQNSTGQVIARSADLAFVHDVAGNVSRLVATSTEGVREINPAGLRAYGWTMHEWLKIDSVPMDDGLIGAPYHAALHAIGAPGPVTWSFESGRIPVGVTLGVDGVLSGVPLETGSFDFQVRATSGSKSGLRSFVMTVNAFQIASDSLPPAVVGEAFTERLRVLNSSEPGTWTLLSGQLPPGITLDVTSGVLSGVPLDSGVFPFDVRVAIGAGTGFARFTLAVRAGVFNIDQRGLAGAMVGADYTHTLRVLNPFGSVTWRVLNGTLPPGLTLDPSGVLTGVPQDSGSFSFEVRAAGHAFSGEAPFTISVGGPTLVVSTTIDAILGVSGALAPAIVKFLDLHGNNNGMFDVGDLLLYLQSRGQLP